MGVKQVPSSKAATLVGRPAASSFGTSKGEEGSFPARREWAIQGVADVIGNARSLDYALETLRDGEESYAESSLVWKADERIKRSCEAGTSLRVAVLVSGGVDSSVALRLLCEAGHSCTAFYLKIWFQAAGRLRKFLVSLSMGRGLEFCTRSMR